MSRPVLRCRLVLALCVLAASGTAYTEAASACNSASFIAELSARGTFQKAISGGLIFRLDAAHLGPKGELDGWEMYLATSDAPQDDYIYPVNPPLRFNGIQIFGASYGDSARLSLSRPHEVRFLLKRADYDHLFPYLTNALWPYNAPHPDRTGDEYLRAAKALSVGLLKVEVLSYQLSAADSLDHMKVQVTVTAPKDFQFQPELKASPSACSAK